VSKSFQSRVHDWTVVCFGERVAANGVERNHGFLEESLELVQSLDRTREQAHSLLDRVFGRDAGEPWQEVGGVMVTLAALHEARGVDLDLDESAVTEIAHVRTKVERIHEKRRTKPHAVLA